MVPGLIKRFDSQIALFISKANAAVVESPSSRWMPGVGQLDVRDDLLDDPCLVNTRTVWDTLKPTQQLIDELKVGDVKMVKVDSRGEWVGE